jgi:hypothetical protein
LPVERVAAPAADDADAQPPVEHAMPSWLEEAAHG